MTQSVLVVAAHSDDEALGCAGTIARHTAQGDEVHIVFLTDGVGARGTDDIGLQERETAAHKAATLMGIASVTQLSFPDNRIDSVPLLDVVKEIEAIGQKLSPSIVYTHHGGDLNVDHQMCHQAVLTAFRPMPGQNVNEIYGFEVASSTEWTFGTSAPFIPQHYVDISNTLELKMQVLEIYAEEMRPFPHARSPEALRALAIWRGANVGCAAAEAFTVLRTIIR